jgi:hypothetical protein
MKLTKLKLKKHICGFIIGGAILFSFITSFQTFLYIYTRQVESVQHSMMFNLAVAMIFICLAILILGYDIWRGK